MADEKMENLSEVLNEVFEVVKAYNSTNPKKANLHQINQNLMYNQKENKSDLSASFISKDKENFPSVKFDKKELVELYNKFSDHDKSIYKCLELMQREKEIINNVERSNKQLEHRVKNTEKDILALKEGITHFDIPKQIKNTKTSRSERDNMEDLIKQQVVQNFSRFQDVLSNLVNYENKFKDMDNMMQTIDTLVKDRNRRDTVESMQPEKDTNGRDTDRSNIHNTSDSSESMESVFKKIRGAGPGPVMSSEYHRSPELSKIVSIPQNGRSTACQPTIRESPHNLVSERKVQNASNRKSSMPNAPFYNSTRNNKRVMPNQKVNRHFSTERNHQLNLRGAADPQTNNSCFIQGSAHLNQFLIDSHPQSRQSNKNNYSRYTGISSLSDKNPDFYHQLQRRGIEKIPK